MPSSGEENRCLESMSDQLKGRNKGPGNPQLQDIAGSSDTRLWIDSQDPH